MSIYFLDNFNSWINYYEYLLLYIGNFLNYKEYLFIKQKNSFFLLNEAIGGQDLSWSTYSVA